MTLSHDRRLTVALMVALSLLIALGVLSFLTNRRSQESARMAAATRQMVEHAHELMAGADAAENGVRGYLLTGERDYLTVVFRGRGAAAAALDALRATAGSNGARAARVAAIASVLEGLGAAQDDLIAAGPRPRTEMTAALAGSAALHQRLGDELDRFTAVEERRLRERLRSTAASPLMAPRVILVADVLALLFFGLVIVLLLRDMRRRAQTERELRMTQQRFYSLTRSLEDVVFALDRDGRITELYGRVDGESKDMIGRTARDLYGEKATVHEEANRRALAGLPAFYDWALEPDGKPPVQYQTAVAPLREPDGAISGIVGVTRDVSVFKDTERKLAQALQEAARANLAKNEFLSRVSHELRTPLHAILGYGQLLAQEPLDDDAAESVDHILRGGRHLLALINEILDISRIESGTLSLSLETVRVSDVVAEVCSFLSHAARPRRVSLEVQVPANLYVRADRQRLRQVLVNLGSNAIKYNREGGRVVFFTEASEGAVRIGVRDTGIGIEPGMQTHLFEPFQRLGADKRGVEGTGLGLVVSKALVEAMGGSIAVESERGIGSTFWTELTRVGPPTALIAGEDRFVDPATDPDLNPDAYTILCIEDNEANLQLVRRILALQGDRYRFVGAANGIAGLNRARAVLPDLILLDLHLPEIDGEDVLQQLRGDPATCDIPVVVLSADATQSRVDRIKAQGAFAYLTKPLDLGGFVATIQDALKAGARE